MRRVLKGCSMPARVLAHGAALAAILLLGGCASFKGTFENRVVCSMDRAESYILSKYGYFGISTEVSPKDVPFICR